MTTEQVTPQHAPQHPGAELAEVIKRLNMSPRAFALHINVNPSTLIRVINGQSSISPEMAVRLEKVLGEPAMKWMVAQAEWDLLTARKAVDVGTIQKL